MTNINQTLAERGARYGRFRDHATIAQALRTVMWSAGTPIGECWAKLADDQKQALETIADKIARILNGDPNYLDNWHDIIGYAKLVEDRLREEEMQEAMGEPPGDALALSDVEATKIWAGVSDAANTRDGK